MINLALYVFVSLVSLVLLYKASAWVIKYSVVLAKILGVSTFVLGFVLVALSTSLPELGVAVFSSYHGEPGLSAGDLLGSNFTDLALILGLCVVFAGTIHLKEKQTVELIELLLISFFVMLLLFYIEVLQPIHGIFLIGIFAVLVKKLYQSGEVNVRMTQKEEDHKIETVAKFVGSLILLLVSAELLVGSVLRIISELGLSASFIGATFMAFGTSVPEISFELTAIKQKKYALAMGDLFGSMVTNVTLIFGVLAIMNPGTLDLGSLFPVVLFTLPGVLLVWYGFCVKHKITKNMGFFLLALYFAYLGFQWFTQIA